MSIIDRIKSNYKKDVDNHEILHSENMNEENSKDDESSLSIDDHQSQYI